MIKSPRKQNKELQGTYPVAGAVAETGGAISLGPYTIKAYI
jgi:hypothetical protein